MTIDDDEATTTLPLLRTRERTMEARRRGTRQHHAVEEKEKNRKVVVSRTPGEGRGEGRWQQPAWAARTPIAPMTSAMLGPDHIYRRKSPAAAANIPWARRPRSAGCRHSRRPPVPALRPSKARRG